MAAPIVLVEVALFGAVVWKLRRVHQRYRQLRPAAIYATDAVAESLRSVFGSYFLVRLLVTECLLTVLALFGWFTEFRTRDARWRSFTYHQKSLYPVLLLVFVLLTGLETVALHLLVQRWSPAAAWVLTALSVYGILWMLGDFHAVRLHPIVLAGERLHLRTGLRWLVTLPLQDIEALQTPRQQDARSPGYLNMAPIGEPHIVLALKRPARATGLFGRTKDVSRIGLFLDDVAAFRAQLDLQRQASQSREA